MVTAMKLTAALLGALLTLTACGGSAEPTKDTTEAPAQTVKRWDVAADSPEGKAYLSGLTAIDPELGDERTIGWGRSTCDDIDRGADVDRNLKMRFAGGGRDELTAAEVATIRELVIANICPDLG